MTLPELVPIVIVCPNAAEHDGLKSIGNQSIFSPFQVTQQRSSLKPALERDIAILLGSNWADESMPVLTCSVIEPLSV